MAKRTKGNSYHGMNWIRKEKRLAIYLRDGLACVWCGTDVESCSHLTLDHIVPFSANGSTDETNLLTACFRCNSSRGTRSIRVFAKAIASYLNSGVTASAILAHVRTTSKRSIDVPAARALIAKRGSFVNALKAE